MYRNELAYPQLQQRDIDVSRIPRFPVSDHLKSFEGRSLMGAAFDQMAMDGYMRQEMEGKAQETRRLSASTGLPEHALASLPPEVLGGAPEAAPGAPRMLMPGTREAQMQTMEQVAETQRAHAVQRSDASMQTADSMMLTRARAEERDEAHSERIRNAHPRQIDPASIQGAIAALVGVPADRPRETVSQATHHGVVVGNVEEPGTMTFLHHPESFRIDTPGGSTASQASTSGFASADQSRAPSPAAEASSSSTTLAVQTQVTADEVVVYLKAAQSVHSYQRALDGLVMRIGTPGTTGSLRGKLITREAIRQGSLITPAALLDLVPSDLDLTDSQATRVAVWSGTRDVAVAPLRLAKSALQRTAGPARQVAGTMVDASATLVRGMGHAADYAVQNQENIRRLGGGLSTLASDLTHPTIGAYAGGPVGFFVGHAVHQAGKLAMRDVAAGGSGQAAASGAVGVAAASVRAAASATSVVRQNFHGSGQRLDMPPQAAIASSSSGPSRHRSASPPPRPWPAHIPKPPPPPQPHPIGPQPPPPYSARQSKAAGRGPTAYQVREEQRALEDAAHLHLARGPRIGPMIAGVNALR